MSDQPESDYIKNAKALLERRDKYVKELEEDYEAAEATIAELTDAANWLTLQRQELTIELQDATQTIAELRKALEEIAATDHEDMNAGYTAWAVASEALAAIAATEEGA